MTLHVVALDTKQFRNKYYSMPNASAQKSFAEQMQAANHVLRSCIEECQITRFSGELTIPDKPIFDGWAEALPDLNTVKECLSFLRSLQYPALQRGVLPWWIKDNSFDVALVDPASVKKFSVSVHECKFFELLLSNLVSGDTFEKFVELGEFLDLSAMNDCGVLAWTEKDSN